MSVTFAPVLRASCEIARLWSRRVSAENRSLRDVGCVAHRDQRVGVGRVAGHADADVVGGDLVERLALGGEDRAVGLEQVAALHARAARTGADQQGEVHAVEDLVGVRADLDAGQQRERAVVELHHDTLERLQRRLDLEQTQLDRAVRAEQRAARQAEQQAVADLAGGTGDRDLEGRSAHVRGSLGRDWCSGTKLAHPPSAAKLPVHNRPRVALYQGLHQNACAATGGSTDAFVSGALPPSLRPVVRTKHTHPDAKSIHVPVARAMVDCGIYVDGKRLPGKYTHAAALNKVHELEARGQGRVRLDRPARTRRAPDAGRRPTCSACTSWPSRTPCTPTSGRSWSATTRRCSWCSRP